MEESTTPNVRGASNALETQTTYMLANLPLVVPLLSARRPPSVLPAPDAFALVPHVPVPVLGPELPSSSSLCDSHSWYNWGS